MPITITKDYQLKILEFLYQFRKDKNFQKLDDSLLNIKPQTEKINQLSQLYYSGLVSFWVKPDEIKDDQPFAFLVHEYGIQQFNEDNKPVMARINILGIQAVEEYNKQSNK